MSKEWGENNFDDRVANLEASWKSAETHEKALTEAEKVWEKLLLELEFAGDDCGALTNVALWGRFWIEEQNPYYIDLAYSACRQAQIEIPATLFELMDQVAEARLSKKHLPGTPKKIIDTLQLSEALRIVCGLHIAGAPVEVASQKVAQLIANQRMGKPLKASTLERRYAERYRAGKPSIEDTMRDGMSHEYLAGWQELLSNLPDADEDRIGNRRD